jgi:hypothetical protein
MYSQQVLCKLSNRKKHGVLFHFHLDAQGVVDLMAYVGPFGFTNLSNIHLFFMVPFYFVL